MANKEYLKGQNLRVFYGEGTAAVVACATSCSVSLSANSENESTKDDADTFDKKSLTSMTGSITSDAMVEVGGQSVLQSALQLVGKTVKVELNITEGVNNQTVKSSGGLVFKCDAFCDSVDINAANKQSVTYSAKFTIVSAPQYS